MTSLKDLLLAAGGEVQLGSAFGRWALAVSDTIDPAPKQLGAMTLRVQAADRDFGEDSTFSSAIVQAAMLSLAADPPDPIVPVFVLSSPLDGTSVAPPEVTVNQDTNAGHQNETATAIDPNNPSRIVIAMNDGVGETWNCFAGGQCSVNNSFALLSTYFSNDGGATWCCVGTSPESPGTIIPGVNVLLGGPYDAASDPSLSFNRSGEVFAAGVGFNVESPPMAVFVSKGTFGAGPTGALTWANPVFVATTTELTRAFDKPTVTVDKNPLSPFVDSVYVTWNVIIFNRSNMPNPQTGLLNAVRTQTFFAYSRDGGQHFTKLEVAGDAILYARETFTTVAPDGTVYVFIYGGVNQATGVFANLVCKSTDGGQTFGPPVQIATVSRTIRLQDMNFRNTFSSAAVAAVAPNGDVYATWTLMVDFAATSFQGDPNCTDFIVGSGAVRAHCKSVCVFSKSTDGGATWSAPALVFPHGNRTPVGYPVTNPNGSTLNAPSPKPIQDMQASIAISPAGVVCIAAYRGTIVSPWQTCAQPGPGGDTIACNQLGPYINNARLEYVVKNLTTSAVTTLSTHPINTRYGPDRIAGQNFIGDYTSMACGTDGVFRAAWTETNNVQGLHLYQGVEYDPSATQIHQMDVVERSFT